MKNHQLMQKVLFIDRDGTLIKEPDDQQVDSLEKLDYLPGVFTYLGRIARQLDYKLVMVTNQDGLGTDSFPEETFWPVHNRMLDTLAGEGIEFDDILIDRHFEADKSPNRKPGTGMLTPYLNGHYDLKASFVIGDRATDVELAKNLGCKSIWITDEVGSPNHVKNDIYFKAKSWKSIFSILNGLYRQARVFRQTSETNIEVIINLNGTSQCNIHTGLGFFDHMLAQICKHGGIDIMLKCQGDLQVDEHHTIEDCALALGEAFRKAMGKKIGMERYGFMLPMDDCLAQVAIDFGGRPWLVWEVEFTREMIGDMPTEMFMHFFKSFSDSAACNLNIKAEGQNEHHKIESVFKAFARAIRMAIQVNEGQDQIPSTKGVL